MKDRVIDITLKIVEITVVVVLGILELIFK